MEETENRNYIDSDSTPQSIGEITDLFFGDDEKIELDFHAGRPRGSTEGFNGTAEQPNIEQVKGKKISSSQRELEEKALIKQAKFLAKLRLKVDKREKAEVEQKLERAKKLEISNLLREKRLRKKGDTAKAYQARLGQANDLSECLHDDVFDYCHLGSVVTRCKCCSRTQKWSPQEWSYHLNKSIGVINSGTNSYPDIFTV